MKKLNLKQKLSIRNQNDLIFLKGHISRRINKTKENIVLAIKTKNEKEYIELFNNLILLRKDLDKIKKRISLNNTIFFINNIIYNREKVQKTIEDLVEISKFREKNNKFFDSVSKVTGRIEETILGLQKKLEIIDKKRSKINNLVLTCLKLKTV